MCFQLLGRLWIFLILIQATEDFASSYLLNVFEVRLNTGSLRPSRNSKKCVHIMWLWDHDNNEGQKEKIKETPNLLYNTVKSSDLHTMGCYSRSINRQWAACNADTQTEFQSWVRESCPQLLTKWYNLPGKKTKSMSRNLLGVDDWVLSSHAPQMRCPNHPSPIDTNKSNSSCIFVHSVTLVELPLSRGGNA